MKSRKKIEGGRFFTAEREIRVYNFTDDVIFRTRVLYPC